MVFQKLKIIAPGYFASSSFPAFKQFSKGQAGAIIGQT
jgi:hypothetical protein